LIFPTANTLKGKETVRDFSHPKQPAVKKQIKKPLFKKFHQRIFLYNYEEF